MPIFYLFLLNIVVLRMLSDLIVAAFYIIDPLVDEPLYNSPMDFCYQNKLKKHAYFVTIILYKSAYYTISHF